MPIRPSDNAFCRFCGMPSERLPRIHQERFDATLKEWEEREERSAKADADTQSVNVTERPIRRLVPRNPPSSRTGELEFALEKIRLLAEELAAERASQAAWEARALSAERDRALAEQTRDVAQAASTSDRERARRAEAARDAWRDLAEYALGLDPLEPLDAAARRAAWAIADVVEMVRERKEK